MTNFCMATTKKWVDQRASFKDYSALNAANTWRKLQKPMWAVLLRCSNSAANVVSTLRFVRRSIVGCDLSLLWVPRRVWHTFIAPSLNCTPCWTKQTSAWGGFSRLNIDLRGTFWSTFPGKCLAIRFTVNLWAWPRMKALSVWHFHLNQSPLHLQSIFVVVISDKWVTAPLEKLSGVQAALNGKVLCGATGLFGINRARHKASLAEEDKHTDCQCQCNGGSC